MDAQLKKGYLDALVMATLIDTPSYGYAIIQELQPITEMSESTLYPILRRLEQQDLVTTYQVPYNGRLRKYYQMTPHGRMRLREYFADIAEMAKITNYLSNKCKGKV